MSDPLVTFSFDDGRSTAVKFGARILEEHSARGTFYPITQCVGTENEHGAYATWEDLRRLDGNGHEVGNHSYSHVREWTTWPARDQLADIEKAGIALMRACFLPPRTFAYPFGLHDAQLRQAVQEACNRSYGAARTIEPGINTPETDPFLLASFMVEQKHTLTDVTHQLERAVAINGWLILTFHHIDDTTYLSTPPKLFREMVRLVQRVARIVTVKEGVREFLRK